MKVLAAVALLLVAEFILGPAEAQQPSAPVVGFQKPGAPPATAPVNLSELVRNLAQAAQAGVTALALVVGGIWAYRKFGLRQERYPHIETSADINFIGKHNNFNGKHEDHWIIELIAWIENKGTAQHKMSDFYFDVYHLLPNDLLAKEENYGGQASFPHFTIKGSFLPNRSAFFFVDPGIKAKYSYITAVPAKASMVIFHWSFRYADRRGYGHTAEITKRVPKKEVEDFVDPAPDTSDDLA
jgi:hypothetical protein